MNTPMIVLLFIAAFIAGMVISTNLDDRRALRKLEADRLERRLRDLENR